MLFCKYARMLQSTSNMFPNVNYSSVFGSTALPSVLGKGKLR